MRAVAAVAALVAATAWAEPAPAATVEPMFRPAAGLDFGMGALIPTIHAPLFHLGGRLGFALRSRTLPLTGLVTGGVGFDAAFASGSADGGQYGYLIRLPLTLMLELIHSQQTRPLASGEWHHHFAIGTGSELAVAANCAASTCNYVPGNAYFDLFTRVGLSYSVGDRSSVGLFVTPHFTFASQNVIATFVVSLGWTSF